MYFEGIDVYMGRFKARKRAKAKKRAEEKALKILTKKAERKKDQVRNGIVQIEAKTGARILNCCLCYISGITGNPTVVTFEGYNQISYTILAETFITIPTKRLIIEISRALTVSEKGFDDLWRK